MGFLEKKKKEELIIFKSHEDRVGTEIEKMSDFFSDYIEEMSLTLKEDNKLEIVKKSPVADMSIISEVIQKSKVTVIDNMTFVPDFNKLPSSIKSKLKKGIYKIGESKQVDGNFRAVILDENDVRIKDITLKKVKNNKDNNEILNNIAIQLQLKQIYEQLNEISVLQTYQIEMKRNSDLIVPFLDARELIIKAETKKDLNERNLLLNDADKKMISAVNAVYTDIQTTSKILAKELENPLNIKGSANKIMTYLVQDLQLATKYNGIRLQLLDYVGDVEYKEQVMKSFKSVLLRFIESAVSKKGFSALELLQNYYPYSKKNMNFWEEFAEDIKEIVKPNIKQQLLDKVKNNKKYLYTISMEDCDDKEQKNM